MPSLTKVYFQENEVAGCCGMSEICDIQKMMYDPKTHKRQDVTWDEAIQEVTQFLDTKPLDSDDYYGYGDYNEDDDDEYGVAYGRRLCIASIRTDLKEFAEEKNALEVHGWKKLVEFPGNHGEYSLMLFGYIPNIKKNEFFLSAKENAPAVD